MKMKRFFSGILAAVMSIAVIATPLSTAIAADDDDDDEKCIITINHAASTGTYTAYPIFVGDVEMETDDKGKDTGRLLIDDPKFHANLETAISAGSVVSRGSADYGLYAYLKTNGTKVNDVSFLDMIKAYDPNQGFGTSFGMGTTTSSSSQQAEALANLLNLTSADTAVTTILNGTKTSAFYSAFAEAARLFMIDNVAGKSTSDLTGTAVGKLAGGKVTIEVDKPGYYLVEYTPTDYSTNLDKDGNNLYEKTPRVVRRSLVLVGKGTDLSATINSKDTQNIASVDIQFNETMLKEDTENDGYVYNGTEGKWSKNVSAGNGDYVNCRVVVTLPGNLADYDQYYLAVPIMYGYNQTTSNNFDNTKSISRVPGTADDPLKYIKTYFIDNDGNKTQIIKDTNKSGVTTESASEIFKGVEGSSTKDPDKDHNATFEIKDANYKYANDGTTADSFVAAETFVISDIANMYVRIKNYGIYEETAFLKTNYANPQGNDNWSKFVIEFPVKFERFTSGLPAGVANLGFNGGSTTESNYTGDDALLKNYITAKAVYSNNPNLKALAEGVDEADLSNSEKLYLDTSKDLGTLQNPVGVAKESSANIVTYRLRVHATTDDLKNLSQAGGVEGVKFVLKDNKSGKYAEVSTLDAKDTYDTVKDEILRDSSSTSKPSNQGKVNVFKIKGWVDDYYNLPTGEGEEKTLNEKCILKTYNTEVSKGIYSNNNSARFEIIGLAPGNYTIIALDETIKTADTYQSSVTSGNEYALSKESNKPKTEYRFSFAPELSETCTKLPYNTHYAPIDADGNWDIGGSYTDSTTKLSGNFGEGTNKHSIITTDNVLIKDFKMKWYDMQGNELKDTNGTTAKKPDWWLGQREDVGLMSMRVTYIKKGLTLPVTGGIGTFIFFAVGGALVVISTVAIVTKFRMKREQL